VDGGKLLGRPSHSEIWMEREPGLKIQKEMASILPTAMKQWTQHVASHTCTLP